MDINPRSVRFRTTAGAALALACVLAFAGLAMGFVVGNEVEKSFDATLLEQARDRARLLDGGADPARLTSAVGEEAVITILDPDGAVLASAGTRDASTLAQTAIGVSDVDVDIIDADADAEGSDGGSHVERLRVAVVEASSGRRVVVGSESESAQGAISSVRTILLLGVPALALLTGWIAWTVTGRALAPVQRMHKDLGRIGSGSARVRQPDTRDEIADLADQMNHLLERLDQQSSLRRQFVSDASHELKSPIANARVILETSAGGTDGERVAMLDELTRLQTIVDDLAFLARHDEASPADHATFDLDDLVFAEAERVSSSTDKVVDASGVIPVRCVADRGDVARAVRNLLENAVRHADGRITAAISSDLDATWGVVIDDDGPGIPRDQRDRIFERFARLGDDRSRDHGGTGLGLAIVASVARRNGGSIEVDESPTGGARFVLRVPRAG